MFVRSLQLSRNSASLIVRNCNHRIASTKTFHEDFQGTRVFVQQIPDDVDWMELKDHFQIAGKVVYASISVDKASMKSKGCGIVQYETTDQAKNAIVKMKNYPLKGSQLFVRQDVQEVRGATGRKLRYEGSGLDERKEARPSATTRYITKESRNPASSKAPAKFPDKAFSIEQSIDRVIMPWSMDKSADSALLSAIDSEAIQKLLIERDSMRSSKRYSEADQIKEVIIKTHKVQISDHLRTWKPRTYDLSDINGNK